MNDRNAITEDEAMTAWVRLVRISGRLMHQVEGDLKAAGMPPLAWYDALLELNRTPDGLRPFQLQDEMLLAQYNMSRLVDRIVQAGYAERVPCDADGRGQIIRITMSGQDLLRKMWPVYRDVITSHFASRLTNKEMTLLSRILQRI